MLKAITKLLPWSRFTEGIGPTAPPDSVPYVNVTPWRASSAVHSFVGTTCEVCGTEGVPVLYGLIPAPLEDEAVIGGCTISPGMPRYACINCGTRWSIGNEDYYRVFKSRYS
jgi:hypothetical protein